MLITITHIPKWQLHHLDNYNIVLSRTIVCMVEIKGLWSGKASDVNPQETLSVSPKTSRFFYQMESEVAQTTKTVVVVYVNGNIVLKELQNFKPNDGIDTGFFDLIEDFRVGTQKIIIEVFEWTVKPEDVKFLYKSPEFSINFE